ncbi:hypothetical protein PTSG_09791 [Salpingoeca rosetta]|uniref:Vesicle-fusing ATPase n=1 Tax=Salpingoeca rosetta (strain ATCC 50818 / BSB-021) TaxID=946362 RepID=F2UP26_SALR5|nr:uncharacterized protein PTSG_09791 [Salpingoeca rosetta]EGD79381.1 hypothetical protein PTSG_09791 [Salpingoeca rosetta]|eukprot:XP_004989150.1 hypothetical protein PTSG_09791 [Salpingoeca rosetta]
MVQKYLGESEKQLRQFFDKAQSTSEDDVHFIIFDELDAIFRERGRGDGSAASMAYDSVVNALLTQMDGLNEINNVIVFGMTNRRELIDPALLRPGRFEVQVEIGLPDFDGRSAILRIHTEEMKENSLLDDGVDLDEIARRTSRYSGAELAGIVRNAASLAVSRVMDRTLDASSFSTEDMANMKINMEDFMTALRELKPAYTDHFDNVNTFYFPHGFLPLSLQHENAHELCVSAITQARLPGATARRILLFGPPGTGKTTLAVHAALASSPDYLKVIRASDLVELTDAHKSQRIAAAFRDAEKAKHAVVVLDDLERLAEIVSTNHLQGSFSHAVVHTLLTSLTSISPASSMIVLATTRHDPRETSFASNALQFQQTFDTTVRVPALTPSDIRSTALALDCDLSHVRFAAAARMPVRSLLQVVHTLRATTSNATIVIDQATFDSHMLEFGFEDHAHAHTAAPAPE